VPVFPARQPYGPHPDQYLEVWTPPGRAFGTLVLIHGGYWRAQFCADLMRPLVPEFLAAGWRVVNVEYRRGADGWSATAQDIHSALTLARALDVHGRLALVGHSVGGQLALLAAMAGEKVVALAPVTDLARSYHEHLGEDAVQEYLGCNPEAAPDLYHDASPLAQVPPAGELLLIHGQDDERVPIAHTKAYFDSIKAAGGTVTLWELPVMPHRHLIAPEAGYWEAVRAWLEGKDTRPQSV